MIAADAIDILIKYKRRGPAPDRLPLNPRMNNVNSDNEISLLFGEIRQYLEEYQNVRNMMYVITVGIWALSGTVLDNYRLFLLPLVVILPSYMIFYDYWKCVLRDSTYLRVFYLQEHSWGRRSWVSEKLRREEIDKEEILERVDRAERAGRDEKVDGAEGAEGFENDEGAESRKVVLHLMEGQEQSRDRKQCPEGRRHARKLIARVRRKGFDIGSHIQQVPYILCAAVCIILFAVCAHGTCQANKEAVQEAQQALQEAQQALQLAQDDYDSALAAGADAQELEQAREAAEQAEEAAEQAEDTFEQAQETYENTLIWDIALGIIAAAVSLFVFVKYFTVRRENFENMWKDVKAIEDKVEVEM